MNLLTFNVKAFGDFDFSELNYDEEEFDKMFEKLNRESQD